MFIRLPHQTVRLSEQKARELRRCVDWLNRRPTWAACVDSRGWIDLDAFGLREPPGLVRTGWAGDRFMMAPTKLGWAVLVHLHPSLDI